MSTPRPLRRLCLLLCLAFAGVEAAAAAERQKTKQSRAAAKKPAAAAKQAPAAAKKSGRAPKAKKSRSAKRSEPSAFSTPAAQGELERRWQEVKQALKPVAVLKLCEDFERDFPGSPYSEEAREILAGAQKALSAQRTARLSSDAVEENGGDAAYRAELGRALRGDGDAARRIARMYGDGSNGLPQHPRRHEQWLQVAAELGDGAASWQLAEILNLAGQWTDAAKYEQRAFDRGYRPPPRLPSRARND